MSSGQGLGGKGLATSERKLEHLRISLSKDVQAKQAKTGFEDIRLVHRAVSSLSLGDVDLSATLLGHRLSSPLLISSMTGGMKEGGELNAVLAEAAEEMGLAIGVGSMRAAIEDPGKAPTFSIVRERAPNAMVIANIGAAQLARHGASYGERAVEMLQADALAVHFNRLQEAVMVEGEPRFKGLEDALAQVAQKLDVPVIAKETGAGFSGEDARALEALGVRCIDVAGAGGTSFAAVEYYRAVERASDRGRRLGLAFWDWGVPTVASILEVKTYSRVEAVCSGGVRAGLDAAKALALGAACVGVARPLLGAASEGIEALRRWVRSFNEELRVAMFLSGAGRVEEMGRAPVVVTGLTREWLKARGVDVEGLSRRCL